VQAARLAAEHASSTVVAELEDQLMDMESSRADFGVFVAADMRFHQTIARAANNVVWRTYCRPSVR
jgi:GntR family transcriptional regulator, transcriptional repressor for pyruvate dehydrogenase complex